MFTGDASGDFLYTALYRAGFANRPTSAGREDGLVLKDVYITAVCRCVPPQNKPSTQEMANCRPYLLNEIELIQPKVFVALGRIAFDALVHIHSLAGRPTVFSHAAVIPLEGGKHLVCSYHPSRQNTQTGRLTVEMFDRVWSLVNELLSR
jgi:uracil-DNA glycosylase family 4